MTHKYDALYVPHAYIRDTYKRLRSLSQKCCFCQCSSIMRLEFNLTNLKVGRIRPGPLLETSAVDGIKDKYPWATLLFLLHYNANLTNM